MRSPEGRAGFTLIEVLAALVVTAVFVAVVLPFAGRLATRWWVGEARVEAADAWMQAVARLSDDLAQAVPIVARQGDKAAVSFDAGPDFVQFVRPALGRAAMGLETVRFEVRSSGAGSALVRRSARFRPGDASAPGSPTTILEGPYRFRFRAYGEDLVPRAAWEGETEMPAGVELTVVGRGGASAPPGPILLPVVARAPSTKPVSINGPSQP